jgi:hypothetical protein
VKHIIGRPARIVIEVLLLAGLVVLFVVILDPRQLREYLLRVTLASILGLLVFQFAIHTVGMLQWVVLLRQSVGIFSFIPGNVGLANIVVSRTTKGVAKGADRIRTGA